MQPKSIAGIILAAGKGTRMKSEKPKGLHRVCGIPMVEHVARAMMAAGIERPIIVIGHGGESIQEALGDRFDYAWQREQLGTGHAALMASPLLDGHDGPVIIAAGDTPLLQGQNFTDLIEEHLANHAQVTLSSSIVADPKGYGRIVRGANGDPIKIVEDKDCTPEEKLIHEMNVGLYCFDCASLRRILPTLSNNNAQGEYYLTDIIDVIRTEGGKLAAKVFDDPDVIVGVNDRWQLALADRELNRRILKRHAMAGVTFLDIESTSVGVDVEIGVDTVIHQGTVLVGKTKIGVGCQIGPFTRIENTTIGDETTIVSSYIDQSIVGNKVWIGPFAHLRPKANVGDKAKVGNFVELKNAQLALGAKINHLSYIGDASVGADANVGAGTITCNYDGVTKSRTNIGERAFVGSNSTLVAPVTIGDGAFIAAGSVITDDVPADGGAFGRARQETKPEWAAKRRGASKSTSH